MRHFIQTPDGKLMSISVEIGCVLKHVTPSPLRQPAEQQYWELHSFGASALLSTRRASVTESLLRDVQALGPPMSIGFWYRSFDPPMNIGFWYRSFDPPMSIGFYWEHVEITFLGRLFILAPTLTILHHYWQFSNRCLRLVRQGTQSLDRCLAIIDLFVVSWDKRIEQSATSY